MRTAIRNYRRTLQGDHRRLLERFRYAGAARKVVGVGSVGTRAWIVLMLGQDNTDPMFLQCKQAQTSVLEPFLGKSTFASHGQRVVEGQRLMQSASDIMLGWVRTTGHRRCRARLLRPPALGRQGLRDRRGDGSFGARRSTPGSAAGRWRERTPAPVTRSPSPATSATSDIFDQAMASFAEPYADQNERDHAALQAAVDSSRLTAEFGLLASYRA